MQRHTRLASGNRWLASGGALLLLASGCGRTVTDAGTKQIGVGLDPGTVQATPSPRGGLIDYTLIDMRGKWLDLGSTITGLYGAGDAFTSSQDPFRVVAGFSYVFTPGLTAADELTLVSPKGPDAIGSCYPLINNVGPLGSFTTVDLGDSLIFQDKATAGAKTRFALDRTPTDYPERTSDVFIYYIGSAPWMAREYLDADPSGWAGDHLSANWEFGQEMELVFGGGIPPETAPVASIPRPSDAADERTNKGIGHPTLSTPGALEDILVSANEGETGGEPLEFDVETDGLSSPWGGEAPGDVLHVKWSPGDDSSVVTLSIRLLGSVPEDVATGIPCAYDPTQTCACSTDAECDGAFSSSQDGIEAFGANSGPLEDCADGIDDDGSGCNCNDGLDNDGDGGCDIAGCYDEDGNFLPPDGECPRNYPISTCDTDTGFCQPAGGSRDFDGFVGELVCTAADSGDFIIGEADLASLTSRVSMEAVRGAILIVSRTSEELIQVPMVRNETGGAEDINPLRLRATHMVVGRLAYDAGQ